MKIFAFDLDGTLLEDSGEIHPGTKKVLDLAVKKGHKLILATGRGLSAVLPFLEKVSGIEYLICSNGSVLFDVKNSKVKNLKPLEMDVYEDFVQEAKNNENIFFSANGIQNIFVINTFPPLEEKYDQNYIKELLKGTIPVEDEYAREKLEEDVFIQAALKSDEITIKHLYEKYREKYGDKYSIVITNKVYLDINPLNASKYNALIVALKNMNKNEGDLISFGDSNNDLDMVKNSSKGYAMQHATEQLKKVATEVIGTNNSDTIGKKLLELI
ncbi:HAD family hydrolase [[Mycoplasma] mobile]|uniref:COF family HAD hydrolase protein n=1 Tax=Mycoplasma mobile (strain ATCC 43663 / 163K / NCTC 11711) TaxID=267748 RepID=Q6KIP5_MYCM1|nr:HAD family hydrolase [[Mycoplasma] mobile]AAT27531.1 COF family HAD hydrolase protein [Mycoplasma mobile 163K]